MASRAEGVALAYQALIVGLRKHLGGHRVVVATVVMRAARDEIGKLVAANEIAPSHLDAIQPQSGGNLVDRRFNCIVRRRLAETPHRLLRRLVRGDGNRAVLHAPDLVWSDDGADRLAELERRPPRIGADIVERPYFHGINDAVLVEGDLDVEDPVRPVRIAGAHVVQPILEQANGAAQHPRQVRDQNCLLDAALDTIAAADIDIEMHPDIVQWNP